MLEGRVMFSNMVTLETLKVFFFLKKKSLKLTQTVFVLMISVLKFGMCLSILTQCEVTVISLYKIVFKSPQIPLL